MDFKLKTVVINDEVVDLQVWDTAGQVRIFCAHLMYAFLSR